MTKALNQTNMNTQKMKHIVDEEENGSQYSYDMNERLGGGGGGAGGGGGGGIGAGDGSSVGHSSTGYSSTRSGGGGSSSYYGADSYSTRNGSSHSKSAKASATGSTSNHDDSHNPNRGNHVSMGEFFQVTLNNGVGDGVVCLKLLVLGTLLLASLVIGNAAFVFTTAEVVETYKEEVRLFFLIVEFLDLREKLFCFFHKFCCLFFDFLIRPHSVFMTKKITCCNT